MRSARVLWAVAACTLVCTPALLGAEAPLPRRYVPGLDGQLVRLVVPADGSTWSAWTYRDGAESDIAVARLGPDGAWSETQRFGEADGVDQLQPALAVDQAGTVYLAFAERQSGRLLLGASAAGTGTWVGPVPLRSVRALASAPALRVVADRLVVAFRDGPRVGIVDLPLLGEPLQQSLGTNDGPDPVSHGWPEGDLFLPRIRLFRPPQVQHAPGQADPERTEVGVPARSPLEPED